MMDKIKTEKSVFRKWLERFIDLQGKEKGMKQMQIQPEQMETTGGFLKCAIWIGMPVVLQNMISSLINLLDVFMLGQLGEVAITASSVSNQWYLLFMILANGVASASGMFISQLWGCRDTRRIHSYMGIMFLFSLLLAFVFGGISLINPCMVIRLYSMDENVILDGGRYLRIISITFWLYAINLTCGTSLRSVGQTNVPMIASAASLCCNLLGNYVLIFGKFGVSQLGITGAAYATVLARMMEIAILLFYIIIKKPPVYASLREIMSISKEQFLHFFTFGGMIILGEMVYAVGSNLYNVAYKYTGTQAQASLQIIVSIQELTLLFCGGFGTATSVMLGMMLGRGDFAKAKRVSRTFTVSAVLTGIIMGGLVLLLSPLILSFFHVSMQSKDHIRIMLVIMAASIPLRTVVYMDICGILRSGGDNTYCFLANLFGVWCVGLPLVFLTAVILKLPIYVVYFMAVMEEAGKLLICEPRTKKDKWLRNLT